VPFRRRPPGGPVALWRVALRALLARCTRSAPFFRARAAAAALFGRTGTRPCSAALGGGFGAARPGRLPGPAVLRRETRRRGRALRRAGLLAAGFAAFWLRRLATLFGRSAGPVQRLTRLLRLTGGGRRMLAAHLQNLTLEYLRREELEMAR
jgi:hypothetical protein